jgi:hypothetical protein
MIIIYNVYIFLIPQPVIRFLIPDGYEYAIVSENAGVSNAVTSPRLENCVKAYGDFSYAHLNQYAEFIEGDYKYKDIRCYFKKITKNLEEEYNGRK